MMIQGIHKALIALGILTIASATVFCSLRRGDGDDVSLHKALHPGGCLGLLTGTLAHGGYASVQTEWVSSCSNEDL